MTQVSALDNLVKGFIGRFLQEKDSIPTSQSIEIIEQVTKEDSVGMAYVRLAGLSGACAVILGAYGAHAFRKPDTDSQLTHVFDTANRYHIIHSAALLAVPLANKPHIVGPLMLSGMVIFCGSCYYHAFTGRTEIRKFTPVGGVLLILGWLAFIV